VSRVNSPYEQSGGSCARNKILAPQFAFTGSSTYVCVEVAMEKVSTTAQANRRKSQRRPPRSSVKLECRMGMYGLGPNLASSTLDLSDNGACLIVTQALDAKKDVEIVVAGYGMNKQIKRSAQIRWQVKLDDGRFCIGVEFRKRLEWRDWMSLVSAS
jgi:hypothetical protein